MEMDSNNSPLLVASGMSQKLRKKEREHQAQQKLQGSIAENGRARDVWANDMLVDARHGLVYATVSINGNEDVL